MKKFIEYIKILIPIALGLFLGYLLGDVILDNSNMIQTKDIILSRIGLPFFGGIVGLLVGIIWVENF